MLAIARTTVNMGEIPKWFLLLRTDIDIQKGMKVLAPSIF